MLFENVAPHQNHPPTSIWTRACRPIMQPNTNNSWKCQQYAQSQLLRPRPRKMTPCPPKGPPVSKPGPVSSGSALTMCAPCLTLCTTARVTLTLWHIVGPTVAATAWVSVDHGGGGGGAGVSLLLYATPPPIEVGQRPQGHEATETGLAYAPVSQAHGHNHIVQCFACCTAA